MLPVGTPVGNLAGNKILWCPWPESNQHSLRNSILSRARLPIPPQGPIAISRKAEVAKPAEYSGRRLPVNPRQQVNRDARLPVFRARPGPNEARQPRCNGRGAASNASSTQQKHSSVLALHLDSAMSAG